jgi:hypothetical protein
MRFLSQLIFWIAVASPAVAANKLYEIQPYTLSGGFSIQSGFVLTDGTLGPLQSANILGFEFAVGPEPYVFASTDPLVSIDILGDLIATPTQIYLPIDPVPSATQHVLEVHRYSHECCFGELYYNGAGYLVPPAGSANIIFADFAVFFAPVHVDLPVSSAKLVVASAPIPEPAALALLAIGCTQIGFRRRRR